MKRKKKHLRNAFEVTELDRKLLEQGRTTQEGVDESNDPDQNPVDEGRLELLVCENEEIELRTARNHEEGSIKQKKIKAKKKQMPDAPAKNDLDRRMLEEGSVDLLVERNLEEASQKSENYAEVSTIEKNIGRKKENGDWDQKQLEERGLKSLVRRHLVVAALQTAGNHEEGSATQKKEKMKNKRRSYPESNDLDQEALEEAMQELLVRVKLDAALQTAENHKEMNAEQKMMKRNKRHNCPESDDLDQKALEEAMQELLLDAALQTGENHKEMNAERQKLKRKKRHNSPENNELDEKALEEVMQELLAIVKQEAALQTTENPEELNVERKKIEIQKKRHNSPESNDLDEKVLEEVMQELLAIVKQEAALQTTENHIELNAEQKMINIKKKKHNSPECNDLDQKALDEPIQELLVKLKPENALLSAENHKEVYEEQKTKRKKKKKKRSNAPASGDPNQNPLKGSLESPVKGNQKVSLLTAENHEEVSVTKKKIKKGPNAPENNDLDQKTLEEDSQELLLPVERNLKDALQTAENHEVTATKKKKKTGKTGPNALNQRDNKLENVREETTGTSFQVVRKNATGEVSGDCLENGHASNKNKMGIKTKMVELSIQGDKVLKQIPTFSLSEELTFNLSEELLVQEDENELGKVQKAVGELGVPSEENLEESPTGCKKEKEFPSLVTRDTIEHVSASSLGLANAQDNPSESCKEGHDTLLLAAENISSGICSANCSYKTPASSRRRVRVKEEKSTVCKVKASDGMAVHDPSSKQLLQKNGENLKELVRAAKQCHVIGKENMEISLPRCKKEEIICSSSSVDVIKDVLRGGVDKEYNPELRVLTLPERAPIGCTRRKLLILDLNGLLADIVCVVPRGYKVDKKIGRKAVFKRPYCDDFLKFCFERFDVGVWSSRTKKNVDGVVDFLMGDMKHNLLFCWDQSHCTQTGFNTIEDRHKPLVLKELKKLWDKHEPSLPWEKGEYTESNTLLLDDSPYKALRNPPHTAVFPYSYMLQDKSDNSLGPGGDIRVYLEGLAMAEHVQKYVEQHPFGQRAITNMNPSWGFFRRVIGL